MGDSKDWVAGMAEGWRRDWGKTKGLAKNNKSWADVWRGDGRGRLGGTSESKIEQTGWD